MKKLFLLFIVTALLINCSATTTKRSTGETLDDNIIVVKLKTKFINDKAVKSSQIKIKSWKGVITLSGVLDSQTAINRAIEIAEEQNGVKEVKAYLVLKDTGVVDEPVIESISDSTATNTSVVTQPVTKKTVTKTKATKKPKNDRAVIETDLTEDDNSVTKSLDQKQETNVKVQATPTIENADYEEVKY